MSECTLFMMYPMARSSMRVVRMLAASSSLFVHSPLFVRYTWNSFLPEVAARARADATTCNKQGRSGTRGIPSCRKWRPGPELTPLPAINREGEVHVKFFLAGSGGPGQSWRHFLKINREFEDHAEFLLAGSGGPGQSWRHYMKSNMEFLL